MIPEGNQKFMRCGVGQNWSSQTILKQQLGGLAYSQDWQPKNRSEFRQCFETNILRNGLYYSILNEFNDFFAQKNVDVTLLKGLSLIGPVYSHWGERALSDMDLLVSPQHRNLACDVLLQNGFRRIEKKKWPADHFKDLFVKTLNQTEVVFELHTQLFWSEPQSWQWFTENSHLQGYQKLIPRHELLHLCGHYVFQHNLIHQHWLWDIALWWQKNSSFLDQEVLFSEARQLGLINSLEIVFSLLEREFLLVTPKMNVSKSTRLALKLIDQQFLEDPTKNKTKYFLLKHFCKDHIKTALSYDWRWLQQKMRSNVST